MRAGLRIVGGLAIALTLALAGCGDAADGPPPPSGPLAEAFGDLGGGGANGSLGVGWVEPRLAKQAGVGTALISDALGPNAGSVVEAAPILRRRFGFDPLAAERLMSVGGSYAFGLRLDGVDGRRLARALVRDGGRARPTDEVDLVDIGDYAVVPTALLRSDVLGLGARDAFDRDLSVLAMSGRARAALLGRGDRLLDEPIYRAAADCLGDVVAARLVPDRLLLSTELGIDLVGMGVGPEGEVLCVLGGTEERAGQIAAALEDSLAPGAREPRTGTPIGDSVAAVEVTTKTYDGVEVVRAELTPVAGQPPGFLFGTVARGSLVPLINGS
ncbi:MAG: hypothetical protein GEU88_04390 [Solirubrobacterales bacterium]|nr:hypothetical protein [Solirubrobacterales bacterium]